MKLQIDKLGKVAVTIEKDYWDINKDYDKLTIVQVEDSFGTYISRKPVLSGTVLTDREYWIPFSSLREDIVLDYNSFKAKYDLELTDVKNILELHTNDIKILREAQTQLSNDINVTLEQVQEMIRIANTTLSTARAAVITANQTSNYVKQKLIELDESKGAPNGIATLDDSGRVPSAQLPSYVDDVLEFNTKNDFPITGESSKIYIDKSTEKTYRWSGSIYIEISKSLTLGETSSTAYAGDKGKKNAEDINKLNTTINSLPIKLVEEISYSSTETSATLDINTYQKTIDNTYTNKGINKINIPSATTEKAGLESATDKAKLESLPENMITSIQSSFGSNAGLLLIKNVNKNEEGLYESSNQQVKLSGATETFAGMMLAEDKKRLNSLPSDIIHTGTARCIDNGIDLTFNKFTQQDDKSYKPGSSLTIKLPCATSTSAGVMNKDDKFNLDALKESNATNPDSIITDLKVQQSHDGSIELQFDKTSSYIQGPIKYYNPSQHSGAVIPVVSSNNSGIMTPELFNILNNASDAVNEFIDIFEPIIVAQSFKPKIYLNDGRTRKLINIGNLTTTTYNNIADNLRFDFEFQPDESLDGLQIKAIITIQVDDEDEYTVTKTHTYKKASTDGGINTGNWFNIIENLAPYILKSRGNSCIVNIKLLLPDYSDYIVFDQNIILAPDKIEPLPTSYTINQTGDILDPDAMVSTNFINYNKLNASVHTDCSIDLKCNGITNDDLGIDSFKAAYEHVHRYVGLQKEDKIYIKELSSNMQTFTDGTDATKYINSDDSNIDIWTSFDVDIYYRVDTANDIHTVTFAIGDKYIDKTDTNWILFPKFTLIGSYKAYVQTLEDNTKILKSKSGVIPTSDSRNNFDTYIVNRGVGFSHINYNAHKFMTFLGYGFLGTTDNGNTIGHGTNNIPSDWSTCYPKKTGLTNSNSVTNTKHTNNISDPLCGTSNISSITAEVIAGEGPNIKSINFFGLENWWGDVYEYLDGPMSMKFTRLDDETSNPKIYVQDYLISKNIDLNNNTYNSFGEDKWVAEITYEDNGNIKTELLNNTNFEANSSKYCVAIVDEFKHIVRFIVTNFTNVMSGCVTKIFGGNKADVIYKEIDSSKTGNILYCTDSAFYCPNHLSNGAYKFIRTYLSNRTRGLIGCYDGNSNQSNASLPYYCGRLMFTNTNNVIFVEPNKSL